MIHFCSFDCQETTPHAKVTTWCGSPRITVSVPIITIGHKLMWSCTETQTGLRHPQRYHMIHFTVAECFFPGLVINLLTTLTVCAMSSLVHTMAYITLPTTEAYGTIFIASSFQLRDTTVNSIWDDSQEENQLVWPDAYWIFPVSSKCGPYVMPIDVSSSTHEIIQRNYLAGR